MVEGVRDEAMVVTTGDDAAVVIYLSTLIRVGELTHLGEQRGHLGTTKDTGKHVRRQVHENVGIQHGD